MGINPPLFRKQAWWPATRREGTLQRGRSVGADSEAGTSPLSRAQSLPFAGLRAAALKLGAFRHGAATRQGEQTSIEARPRYHPIRGSSRLAGGDVWPTTGPPSAIPAGRENHGDIHSVAGRHDVRRTSEQRRRHLFRCQVVEGAIDCVYRKTDETPEHDVAPDPAADLANECCLIGLVARKLNPLTMWLSLRVNYWRRALSYSPRMLSRLESHPTQCCLGGYLARALARPLNPSNGVKLPATVTVSEAANTRSDDAGRRYHVLRRGNRSKQRHKRAPHHFVSRGGRSERRYKRAPVTTK